MNRRPLLVFLLTLVLLGGKPMADGAIEIPAPIAGQYSVASTNMQVATGYADMSDDDMQAYLLGLPKLWIFDRFVTDIMAHPEDAWVFNVPVPKNEQLYGPVSGESVPLLAYVTYPSAPDASPNAYQFPYQNGQFGDFENMLKPGESPEFADPKGKYPLVIFSHGMAAHGIYDVRHAHDLSRSGYIVLVLFYGDDRWQGNASDDLHSNYLRPFLTKAGLDHVLADAHFGPRIDTDNIGIYGHSFGGFTTYAMAGGKVNGNSNAVTDPRIKAGVAAAPWTGGFYNGNHVYAFGAENQALSDVKIPMLTLYGSDDQITQASYILPATKHLAGDRYVVELVDQPHVFEEGSWVDKNNWELLFFNAYLKQDKQALQQLREGTAMAGGNTDRQLFEYQQIVSRQ